MSARPPVIVLSDCCDLHGRNCEPPSELCCWLCTESDHPDHRKRVPCSAPNLWCYSHTCPNGPMPHLANASCSTGRDTKDTMTTPPAEPCRASVRIGCPDSPATLVCHQPAPHPGLNHYDAGERIYWQRTDAEPWLLASPPARRKPLLTGTPGMERRDGATVDLAAYQDDPEYRAMIDAHQAVIEAGRGTTDSGGAS